MQREWVWWRRFVLALTLGALAGCASQSGVEPAAGAPIAALKGGGRVMGGQQPVAGATIQLYAVGTAGDGSGATPLLPVTNPVTSDANGNFAFGGDYSCANATEVYLVATGGNPGLQPTTQVPSPTNPNLVLMAALGPCTSLGAQTFIQINELTTVAAVVALQPYMTGFAAVGSGTSDAAALAQAFTLANELVGYSTGSSPGVGVPAGMAAPTPLLNTLADMLAACVNSGGGIANDGSSCGTLFQLTTLANPAATPTVPAAPAVPTDTVGAMLNLAIDPSISTAPLLKTVTGAVPFQPTLGYTPANLRARLHPGGATVTPANGYLAFGDSNTTGDASTTPYVPGYPYQLFSLYFSGTPSQNLAQDGSRCFGMNNVMFANLNPQDSGSPVVSDMIGTNDGQDAKDGQLYLLQCQFANNVRAGVSATYTVPAASPAMVQSGVWTADTSYASLGGEQSTTNGSCLTASVSTPAGVVYVLYGLEYLTGSGGTLAVSVDGSVATDTISGGQTLATPLGAYLSGQGTALHFVGAARYAVSAGTHSVAACVTSATASANDVHVYAFVAPPGGGVGPRVLVGGVMHLQSDPNDTTAPGSYYANLANQTVANQLAADGLNVSFVDVRSYVDPYLGMLSSPADGCGASGNPGLHVNDCGAKDLAQAFADAMGLVR
jgi:hypothetical protein